MEMKNICGKIPVDLHEKMKLEIEELGICIPKYLEMVIEEHMTRKGEKTNMADFSAPSQSLGFCFLMYILLHLLNLLLLIPSLRFPVPLALLNRAYRRGNRKRGSQMESRVRGSRRNRRRTSRIRNGRS